MKSVLSTLVIAALAASALPASAENGNTSLKAFQAESAKARAAGGYGNPVVAVPVAVADAMTDAVDAMTGTDRAPVKAVSQGNDQIAE